LARGNGRPITVTAAAHYATIMIVTDI